jgi:PAS domain S-box-containing protein
MDSFDWSGHPFGIPEDWPRALHSALHFLLDAAFPAAMWLGPELRLIYNDAYAPILGPRHPEAFGTPGKEVWGELWDVIGPQFAEVMATQRGVSIQNQMLPMTRFGYTEETYWDYTLSPLTDDDGNVSGVFNQAHDVTASEFQRRNDKLIIALNTQLISLGSAKQIIDAALQLIGEHVGARRTGYGEVDTAAGLLNVEGLWVTDSMPDIRGIHPLGAFGNISDELRRGETVVVADNETDPRTADAATVARYRAIGLRAGIVVPIIDRGAYVGGVFVQDSQPRRWEAHQVAFIEAAARKLWQALLRFRTETALRDRDQSYRLIFEQANDIIFTADIEQRIMACNDAGAAALGYPREAIVGRSIAEFVSADDFKQTTAMLQKKLNHGGNTRHEVGVIGADGRLMRWENDSTLILDPAGRPMGLLSISRDVTERRAFEERRELLIHELNHRVKNTLSLVQAIAHQSFRIDADIAVVQTSFNARLRTLASAHDLLTREHWEGVTLAELVRAATTALDRVRVAARGPALSVTPKAAVALAMALHELGTNAVKYGALSAATGHVDIGWSTGGDRLRLEWGESGGPEVAAPERRGFGIKMIEKVLASDLGGSVTMSFDRSGVRCLIDAPQKGNIT